MALRIHQIVLFCFSTLAGIATTECVAQSNYASIDRYALATPATAENSIISLARYFNRDSLSNREKLRAVYRWMTDRIEYDIDAYLTGWPVPTNPGAVFGSRYALCEGYTALFCRLTKAMQIPCKKIEGYVRSFPSFHVDTLSRDDMHSWNAVFIENEWRMVDPTFSVGNYDSSTNTYLKHFNDGFFLVKPERFIHNYYPFGREDQFLDRPVSFDRFLQLPVVSSHFFEFPVDLPDRALNEMNVRGKFSLRIGKTDDVVMGVLLEPATDDLNHYYSQTDEMLDRIYRQGLNVTLIESEDGAVIEATLYEKRPYTLYLYGRRKGPANEGFKPLAVIKIRNREVAPVDRDLKRYIQAQQ